ncbi:amino acid ABC transporter permease [Salinibacterium sp. TMP30]|uniref:amino acid ABC transporter permease n=1 Tax=Salinibacterium sp. TMP30 TaxID=3138237 RepID=UPI0031391B3D
MSTRNSRIEDLEKAAHGTGAIHSVPVRHPGQAIAGALLVLALGALIWSIVTNDNIRWAIVFENLTGETILRGLGTTLLLTAIAMLIGLTLGVLLAIARLSKNRVMQAVSAGYIWLFRGTPLLVQLLLWFNLALFFPRIGIADFSIDTNVIITAFGAAILGLGLNEGAYMAEIVRGGIQSVNKGQIEAAAALGMRQRHVTWRIVLPQAMRVIIPPIGNNLITMLKMTSLVSVIAVPDLLNRAQAISAKNFYVFEMLIVATIWYLVMTTIFTILQMQLEKRFDRGFSTSSPRVGKRLAKNLRPGRVSNTELLQTVQEKSKE